MTGILAIFKLAALFFLIFLVPYILIKIILLFKNFIVQKQIKTRIDDNVELSTPELAENNQSNKDQKQTNMFKHPKFEFYLFKAALPLVILSLSIAKNLSPLTTIALLVVYIIAYLAYRIVENYMITRRNKKIIEQLPNAIDLIARAISTGRSVPEALEIVANDFGGIIGKEFKKISEGLKLGRSLESVLSESADHLNIAPFRYFTIVLIMQTQTGGNIVALLNNLTESLRARYALDMKIKALSAEPLASATMLSVLPFLVVLLVTLLNPKYMMPLFTDPMGQFVLAICLCSQVIGMLVIKKLIKLDV